MDAYVALNHCILTRVLNEAVRRGDVVMRLDRNGVPRYSAARTESPVVSQNPR